MMIGGSTRMTQLLAIDDDFHAALKLMAAHPKEKRGMKAIVQEHLTQDKSFTKILGEARNKMGINPPHFFSLRQFLSDKIGGSDK